MSGNEKLRSRPQHGLQKCYGKEPPPGCFHKVWPFFWPMLSPRYPNTEEEGIIDTLLLHAIHDSDVLCPKIRDTDSLPRIPYTPSELAWMAATCLPTAKASFPAWLQASALYKDIADVICDVTPQSASYRCWLQRVRCSQVRR